MSPKKVVELSIAGMDCADCVRSVQKAIEDVPGVARADVLLSAEKAIIRLNDGSVEIDSLKRAVSSAGYEVRDQVGEDSESALAASARSIFTFFGVIFGLVLFIVVIGEWLGVLEAVTSRIPWPLMLAVILIAGAPIFRSVLRAGLKRRVTSHTLMTVGMLAAVAVGEWAAAAVVVFFMRLGDYTERFTAERARRALKDLTALAPQTARVVRDGEEREVDISAVQTGDIVVVRPGEKIPVDGEIVTGQATIDQAAITGESMPVDAGPGTRVFAATIARLGSLRIRVERVGAETTFGRVIKMVEEAEANRADVQQVADRFSTYYLPVVAGVAALTFLFSRDALATAAVLLVACSCSFALATPVAMTAAIGAGARRGLLIKGGKYLEALARADVLLIDKTGTLTLGRPHITDVRSLNGLSQNEILALAASAEKYSEHPLAEAVRETAAGRGIQVAEPLAFEALPGRGVGAEVNGRRVTVGSRRLVEGETAVAAAEEFEQAGKTLLYVTRDRELVGVLAASDTLRAEVPAALASLPDLGINHVELLTGDRQPAAAALADQLGIDYRAELLPEDKIAIVKEYQARGHTVVMIGDGVNDAPALAQADIGIAMGAAGTDIAIDAAHIALMRDDWSLVPDVLRIARRTLRVIRINLWFTTLYNFAGLSLAAFGFLPPTLAAAAQSLPDLGILANSSRLLRQR